MSNTLLVNTASTSPRLQGAFGLEEWSALTDDQEIPLKVTMVTGSAIHLDWSAFLGPSDVACYRVQWSSVAQPTVSTDQSRFHPYIYSKVIWQNKNVSVCQVLN